MSSQPREKPDQAADNTEGCPDPRTKGSSMTDCHGFLLWNEGVVVLALPPTVGIAIVELHALSHHELIAEGVQGTRP